jgi:hypothetical protein
MSPFQVQTLILQHNKYEKEKEEKAEKLKKEADRIKAKRPRVRRR